MAKSDRNVRFRRGAMSDPSASYELWIFWNSGWERRACGYRKDEFSTGGYGQLADDCLEIRAPEDYSGPVPEWCVEV